MTRKLQGADELLITAPVATVWALLVDGARLVEWMPLVKQTDAGREVVGAVRHCRVVFGSRAGEVVERCVESVPERRIMWRVESETLGFSRHFADFGFGFILESHGRSATLVRTESYYQPKGIIAALLNQLLLRRKYHAVRCSALAGLKRVAESSSPMPP